MLNFSDALYFRHATRHFDVNKEIPENDLKFILDSALKAPSSLNLEHWEYVVVQDKSMKSQLKEASFNQQQVEDASAVVVILAKKDTLLDPNSPEVKKLISERIPENGIPIAVNFLQSFPNSEAFTAWSKSQCYITASFLMMAAATLEIDSCPMEGFMNDDVLKLLNYSSDEYEVALVVPLGYRKEPTTPEKVRASLEEKVTFV
ncbi:NAD(P)H-dependent oxidoreductase [Bacillus spongiae]|uniref:NAD(P)H-dependent oxidoreductase n=1 Tax=Bacillus spongiae TaxID=2683610 RepID=A0ABU8HJT6_9BACI